MSWEEIKPILRPELDSVHMGVMKVDEEKCIQCGLCMENCPFQAWETDENDVPKMKASYECFSCYNCMVACPEDAVEIVSSYHVGGGYWATDPKPLPARMPLDPKDDDGNPCKWNAIEQAILERRSVRNFKDKPVPESYVRRVLEAGRFAPSAGNCQPWKFVVVTNKDILGEINEKIFTTIKGFRDMYMNDELVKGLEAMASEASGVFDPRQIIGGSGAISKATLPPLLNAPVLIILAGDTRAISNPEINIGISGQNMNLVANSLGIKACWVGFIAVLEMDQALKEKLGIQPPWKIVSSLILGYPRFPQEGIVPREYRPVAWLRDGSDKLEIEE